MTAINFGDVIYVERDCGIFGYKHFGICSGNRKVIHYTKDGGDAFDGVIRETSLARFLDGGRNCYVCLFDSDGTRRNVESAILPTGIFTATAIRPQTTIGILIVAKAIYDLIFGERGKLYSPEDTVNRARSRLGEHGYNLLLHNCEHFAVWCKTGVEKSEQVDELLELVAKAAIKA